MPHFGEPRTWPEKPDWLIYQENSRFKGRSGWTSHVDYRSDELAELIEDVINSAVAYGDKGLHVHIKAPPKGYDRYLIERTVVLKSPFRLTGPGKNRIIIDLADNVNDNMFELTPAATRYICEFANIKFEGNETENTAGTGIVNNGMAELLLEQCEFKAFKDYGVYQDVSAGYNLFHGCFFLEQPYIKSCDSLIIDQCFITNTVNFPVDCSVKAVVIGDCVFFTNGMVQFNGGTIKNINIHDNIWTEARAWNTACVNFVDLLAPIDVFASIHNNTFTPHATAAPGYAIYIGDDWDEIDVQDNMIKPAGWDTAPIGLGTVGPNVFVNNNFGNVGKYQTTANNWAGYAGPTGAPTNGTRVLVYSSGEPGFRLYTYLNGAWHYVTLT